MARTARALVLMNGGWFGLTREFLVGEAGATIIPGHEPELWTQLGQPPVRLT